MSPHTFVFAVVGDAHVARVNRVLPFLRRYSRAAIVVVTARTTAPVAHDQVIAVPTDPALGDRQASVLLKTGLHRVVGPRTGRCCYLDSDVVAVSDRVDAIFDLAQGPVAFAADHVPMRTLSPWAVRCACAGAPCDHLAEAIRARFGVVVGEPDWRHWNGGVFVFDAAAWPLLDTWHEYSRAIMAAAEWRTRDQGTLIAAAWRHGLQDLPLLPRAYNTIVDRLYGVPEARRGAIGAADLHVDRSYSLAPDSPLPRPHLLHFVNEGVGARGWPNWDEAEALLCPSGDGVL